MPDKRLGIELTAKDNASAPIKGLGGALDEMATGALRRVGDSAMRFVQQLPQMAVEMIKAAAADEALNFRLTQFAGSASKAAEYTKAFQQATENTIPDTTAMAGATRLLQLGLAETAPEMAAIAAAAVRMGDQTQDAGSRIDTFTNMLAMRSTRALKDFGISAEVVQDELKKVKAAGGDVDEAFKRIVMEQASKQLGTLGDTSELASTKMAKLTSAVDDAKDGIGALMLGLVDGVGGVDQFADRIRKLPDTISQLTTVVKYGYTWWDTFVSTLGNAKMATWEARDSIRDTIPKIEELTEKTGGLTFITNEEVTARLAQAYAIKDVIPAYEGLASAFDDQGRAQELSTRMTQLMIDKLNEEKLALLGLNETLMDASAAQVAKVAIDDLTQAYNDGKISADDYAIGVTVIQLNAGLATPASIALNEAIAGATNAMRNGNISAGEYATRIGELGGKARGTVKDVDELGRSVRNLPDGKTIHINTLYTYSGKQEGPGLGRQSGGYAAGVTIVGEAGPEAVILPAGSYVIPHEATKALLNKKSLEGISEVGLPGFAAENTKSAEGIARKAAEQAVSEIAKKSAAGVARKKAEGISGVQQPTLPITRQEWVKPGEESWYSKYTEGGTSGPKVSITFRQNFYVDVASTKQQAMEIANGIEEQLRMRAISRVFA